MIAWLMVIAHRLTFWTENNFHCNRYQIFISESKQEVLPNHFIWASNEVTRPGSEKNRRGCKAQKRSNRKWKLMSD